MDTKKILTKKLSISRINPDNVRPISINDAVITHSDDEFFITFSSIEPPAVLNEAEINKINEVHAITRTKITVSPQFLDVLIKALTNNLETYRNKPPKE